MSKLVAIPLIVGGGAGLFWGIPGLADQANATWACWPAAGGMACLLTALCILAGGIRFEREAMKTVPNGGTGGVFLLPRQTQEERVRNAILLLMTVAGPAVILAAYLEFKLRPGPVMVHVFATAAGVVFIGLLVVVLRRRRARGKSGDPRIILSSAEIGIDQPFEIRLAGAEHGEKFHAGIVCFEHILMHLGRFVHVVERQHVEIALPLPGPTQIVIDSIQYPASGRFGATMYPFYHWEIRVWPKGDARSATVFPLTVKRREHG